MTPEDAKLCSSLSVEVAQIKAAIYKLNQELNNIKVFGLHDATRKIAHHSMRELVQLHINTVNRHLDGLSRAYDELTQLQETLAKAQ